MTDVLRKFNHNGFQSVFQANHSVNMPQRMVPPETMEDILSKVCFAKNESFATSLPPYDLSGNKLIFPSGDTKKVYFCQRCLNHKHNVPRKNHKSDCPFANCKCELCILVEKRRKLNSRLNDLETVKMAQELTVGEEEDPYKQGNGCQSRNGKGPQVYPLLKECAPVREHRLPSEGGDLGAWHGIQMTTPTGAMTQLSYYSQTLPKVSFNLFDPLSGAGGSLSALDNLGDAKLDVIAINSAIKSVLESESPSYSKRVPNCQKCGQHGKKSRLKGHKRVCPFRECDCVKCEVVTERQKLMADQIKIRRRQKKDNLMNMTRDHIASQIQAAAALSSGLSHFPFNAINSALLYQLKAVPNSILTSPASSDGSSYSPQSSLGSAFSAPTSTPEMMKSPAPILPPSPPSPIQPGIVAPVAINPATPSTGSPFSFPLSLGSDSLLSLLANYKLLEQKMESDSIDVTNSFIDVCH